MKGYSISSLTPCSISTSRVLSSFTNLLENSTGNIRYTFISLMQAICFTSFLASTYLTLGHSSHTVSWVIWKRPGPSCVVLISCLQLHFLLPGASLAIGLLRTTWDEIHQKNKTNLSSVCCSLRMWNLNIESFIQGADLHKVPRVHLLERDLQVQYYVVPSGDVPVLLLPVSSKHEPKVPKEAAETTEDNRWIFLERFCRKISQKDTFKEPFKNTTKSSARPDDTGSVYVLSFGWISHLSPNTWGRETHLEKMSLWEPWWPSLSPSSPYASYCFLFSSSERTWEQTENSSVAGLTQNKWNMVQVWTVETWITHQLLRKQHRVCLFIIRYTSGLLMFE